MNTINLTSSHPNEENLVGLRSYAYGKDFVSVSPFFSWSAHLFTAAPINPCSRRHGGQREGGRSFCRELEPDCQPSSYRTIGWVAANSVGTAYPLDKRRLAEAIEHKWCASSSLSARWSHSRSCWPLTTSLHPTCAWAFLCAEQDSWIDATPLSICVSSSRRRMEVRNRLCRYCWTELLI